MASTTADKFHALVATLNGPSLTSEDVQDLQELPLVRWFAEQLSSSHRDPATEASTLDGAAARRVALENEEYIHYNCFRGQSGSTSLKPYPSHPCVAPSIAQKCLESTQSELELLQSEIDRLKHRLKSTKTAEKSLRHTAKSLQEAIDTTNEAITQQTDRLSELSIKSGTTIASAVSSADQLLEDRTSTLKSADFKSTLLSLLENHSTAISLAESQLNDITDLETTFLSPEELQDEANRLQTAFQRLKPASENLNEVTPSAYRQELLIVCEQLEQADDIDSVIQSLSQSNPTSSIRRRHDPFDIDVKSQLEEAWDLDQLTLLLAKERVYDKTRQAFEDLIPLFQTLLQDLSAVYKDDFEIEALVNALLEELEETADDVDNARDPRQTSTTPHAPLRSTHDLLKEKLKELKDLRPSDALPLVLLDDEDLKVELAQLDERLGTANKAQHQWLTNLSRRLHDHSEKHQPILNAIYANSPVNTSPPLQSSPELAKLEADARKQVENMSGAIVRLQQNATASEQDGKKLHSFVKKWGK